MFFNFKRPSKKKEAFYMKKYWKIIFAAIVLIVIIVFASISYFDVDTSDNNTSTDEVEEGDIRIAAVGDSITYGLMIDNWSENNYPSQLDGLLGEGYAVGNFGKSNYSVQTSADFSYETTDSFQNSLDFNPDIVVLILGTNDTKTNNWEGKEQFKQEYLDLLAQYQDLSNVSRIILASPPRVFLNENVPEGSIDPNYIDDVRNVVEEIAREEHVEYVDLYSMSYNHPEWFPDGIHPNAEGAGEIADTVYNQLKNND